MHPSVDRRDLHARRDTYYWVSNLYFTNSVRRRLTRGGVKENPAHSHTRGDTWLRSAKQLFFP